MNTQHPISSQRGMALAMSVLAWISFMVLVGFFFQDLLARQLNPNRQVDSRLDPEGFREVVLARNKFGHYVTSGLINGQPVVFLLDTGATGVAIPAALANKLGIKRGQAYPTRTANGTSVSYATRLASVSVGEIEVRDVMAGITPGLQGNEVLLGMSFLREVEFTQRGSTLTLRQYP